MDAEICRRLRLDVVRSTPIALVLASIALLAFPTGARGIDRSRALPIVFVHGFGGSATQYASVARRFVSNGYSADRIRAFEYDSSIFDTQVLIADAAALDVFIDRLRAEFSVDRIDLVGHSLGTAVSNIYLSVPAWAAKVAHYFAVDGFDYPACGAADPNQVLRCKGLWRGSTGNIGGNNVYLNFTQSHVESSTSPESFAEQYRFFTGEEPATTLILPEPPGQVKISGRIVNFPQNTGADDATLVIWEVDGTTGRRVDAEPIATLDVGSTGDWGPVQINGQQHYELEMLRPGFRSNHFYYQPFSRSDHWIRLLTAPANSPIALNTIFGPNHAVVVVFRNREFLNDPSNRTDVLYVGTRSPGRGDQAAVNALQNVTGTVFDIPGTPSTVHMHDNPADGVSSLKLIPFFDALFGQTGVDVYMPTTDPPDGTITLRSLPRGDTAHPQVINVPNWASDQNRIGVVLNDYVQDINTWGECKRAKPSPCK